MLEGHIFADDVKYDVKDAYKIRNRSIVWRFNKKGIFDKGSSVFINTKDFFGRQIEKEPNPHQIRSLERGYGTPFLYLPPVVQVIEGSNGIAFLDWFGYWSSSWRWMFRRLWIYIK